MALEEEKLLKQAKKSTDEFKNLVEHLRARGYDTKSEWIQNNADVNRLAKLALIDFQKYATYVVEKKKNMPDTFFKINDMKA